MVLPSCGLAFCRALSLEDEIHELLPEIRGRTNVPGPDVDLVQVLEPQDVAVTQLGYDSAEEEAKVIQACSGTLRGWVGER